MEISIWILIFLPLIAFLYSSVGHGGASSYITLFTLLGYANSVIKPTALIINILISLVAFLMYWKTVHFPWKLFFWLVVFSIPMAYLGGQFEINPVLYRRILGVLLLFPIARFLNILPNSSHKIIQKNNLILVFLGISIGFVSGIIGIGGGIILSPVLLILGWTTLKETSAVSALFIFVNSISGFISLFQKAETSKLFQIQSEQSQNLMYCILLSVMGGLLGSYLGARKFENKVLKNILTFVLLIASIKLIY